MHDKRRTALAARLLVLSLSSCSLAGQRRRPERPRRRPAARSSGDTRRAGCGETHGRSRRYPALLPVSG